MGFKDLSAPARDLLFYLHQCHDVHPDTHLGEEDEAAHDELVAAGLARSEGIDRRFARLTRKGWDEGGRLWDSGFRPRWFTEEAKN